MIYGEIDSWNVIGHRNTIINLELICFLCKCTDITGLDIASIPKYYQDTLHAWNNFLGTCSTESKNDISDKNIFGTFDCCSTPIQQFFSYIMARTR
jgi:hypothetical protein